MEALQSLGGPVELIPAYGRVYKTREECVQAWMDGKDFKILNGPYCSVRDQNYLRFNYSTVWILWNRCDAVRVI